MNKNDVALSSYLRELGVTREHVRQLEAAALGKLRRAFKKTPGSDRNRASRRRVKRHRKKISSLVKCSPPNSGDRGVTQQTMNANDADISGESQRELAAGVLKQAAQDLRRFHGATSKSSENFTAVLMVG